MCPCQGVCLHVTLIECSVDVLDGGVRLGVTLGVELVHPLEVQAAVDVVEVGYLVHPRTEVLVVAHLEGVVVPADLFVDAAPIGANMVRGVVDRTGVLRVRLRGVRHAVRHVSLGHPVVEPAVGSVELVEVGRAVLVDLRAVRVDESHLGVLLEGSNHFLQAVWQHHVVVVELDQVVAGGEITRLAFKGANIGNSIEDLPNLYTLISLYRSGVPFTAGASVEQDDPLPICERLSLEALEALSQVLGVVAGREHRNLHSASGWCWTVNHLPSYRLPGMT